MKYPPFYGGVFIAMESQAVPPCMCYTMVKRGGEGGANMHIYDVQNRTPEQPEMLFLAPAVRREGESPILHFRRKVCFSNAIAANMRRCNRSSAQSKTAQSGYARGGNGKASSFDC